MKSYLLKNLFIVIFIINGIEARFFNSSSFDEYFDRVKSHINSLHERFSAQTATNASSIQCLLDGASNELTLVFPFEIKEENIIAEYIADTEVVKIVVFAEGCQAEVQITESSYSCQTSINQKTETSASTSTTSHYATFNHIVDLENIDVTVENDKHILTISLPKAEKSTKKHTIKIKHK